MASILGKVYNYLSTGTFGTVLAVEVPPVQVYDVETAAEKRPRTLKHLLKANHINFSVFYNDLRFHNHMPHVLSTAYILGADVDHLQHIYDQEAKELEPWHDSPDEVSGHDWRDFLGKKEYQRGFIDFFEDELALNFEYNWKRVAEEYLYQGDEPLINCLVSGLGHPLIHLGYAYEMNSREIGIEALAMAAGGYSELHKYADDSKYTFPVSDSTTSIMELLGRIAKDSRLKAVSVPPEEGSWEAVPAEIEEVVLEYWNSWEITNPTQQFQDSQQAAIQLLVSTVGQKKAYDFFLVHLLTTSHAVRVLLPLIRPQYHMSVVRQWWLLTILTFISRRKPHIDHEAIPNVDVQGKDWDYVVKKALTGSHGLDSHFLKGLRSMKAAAATWDDPDQWYLKAAVKFVDEFGGWHFT